MGNLQEGRIRRLRACFAMLDVERRGFVRNDRLASVLAAGDAFSRRAARGGDLDAAAAFLHARVHERAPELGFVSTRDARDGHVSLRECEAHFLAAARSGFVPDFRAAETNDARLPKKTKKKKSKRRRLFLRRRDARRVDDVRAVLRRRA